MRVARSSNASDVYHVTEIDETMLMWMYDGLRSQRDKLAGDIRMAILADVEGRHPSTGKEGYKASEDISFLAGSLKEISELMQLIEATGIATGYNK